jgi:hypothetical protein
MELKGNCERDICKENYDYINLTGKPGGRGTYFFLLNAFVSILRKDPW